MLHYTDREYLIEAYDAAKGSPDPSTQNGSIIPFTDRNGIDRYIKACNQQPIGVQLTPERLERPLKYAYIEHAERGAVYLAANNGIALAGLTMYCPWAACCDCARAIILSGIKRVVTHGRMMDLSPDHWKESIAQALGMFEDCGVKLERIEEELPEAPAILFNGKLWQP